MHRRERRPFVAIGCLVAALLVASLTAGAGAQETAPSDEEREAAPSASDPCAGQDLEVVAVVNGETLCTHGEDRLPPPPPEPTSRPFSVNSNYRPFAGDFNGTGGDEIFWYAPGVSPDPIWFFGSNAAVVGSRTETVDGSYTPAQGDYDGNGRADVLWYGTGSNPDTLWLDDGPDGFVVESLSVNGSYVPVPGRFGLDALWDLVMYQAGSAPDSLWTARLP